MSDLTALALNAAHRLSVAELHGAVCGFAVSAGSGGTAFPLADLVALVGVDALTDEVALDEFVAATLAELRADDLRFMPLLPDDDVVLALRLDALAEWCAGFLAALGAALAADTGSGAALPDELQEIVADLQAISEVDADLPADEADAPDALEAEFVELQEFVKVGVLLIMSVLDDDPDRQTV